MKVILIRDVQGLGEEGDVYDVKPGYARNYLIPQQHAAPHTKHNVTLLEHRRGAIESRKEEKRKEALGVKDKMEEEVLTFAAPASEGGKLFGSVSAATVAEELVKRGYDVERKRVELPDSTIRMVGTYTAQVKIYGNEEARVKVVVEKTGASGSDKKVGTPVTAAKEPVAEKEADTTTSAETGTAAEEATS